MKLTRRQLAATLVVAPLADTPLPAAPQTEDLDAAARDRVMNATAALRGVDLPIATEPAFQFKVG